jgi:Alpha/beta hydrolase domain
MRLLRAGLAAALVLSVQVVPTTQGLQTGQAGVTRLEITGVESPAFDGRNFGEVGQYEKLTGRVYGQVDPNDPRNQVIVDLDLAPRNADGMVEYSADFLLFKPIDLSKGNHRLFYELNNRGDTRALTALNDAKSAEDAGNGFLMEQGYAILDSGWDATAPSGNGRLTLAVPVAKNPDGSSITGPALEEFVIDDAKTMSGPLTYAAATADKSQASLAVRTRYEDPPTPLPADGWEYTDDRLSAVRLTPSGTAFQQGSLYEFSYQAKDPLVTGLGFAAIRDVGDFIKHGQDGNPLAGDVQAVYSHCVSQPCRTMHDFLWLGFNQGAGGSRVVDGILNWIGGGDGIFMNYRFAQPGRTHRQHIARWYPEFQFPFANQVIFDPVTGKTDGRLARCTDTGTCPDILEVNSENEYWAKDMSVFQLDGEGKDLPDPANVRYFLMSSLPHAAGTGAGICQQNRNPLVPNPVIRALLVDLDQWVTGGVEPPASRMPRVADGTLVPPLPQDGVGFPAIPNVVYNGRMHTGDLFDFGPQFDRGILSVLPPRLVGTPYPMLAPKTDADGNDVAGVRLPDVATPLATYTGWGLRAVPAGVNDGCDAAGQKIDFAATRAEREASGDPRLSLEERYPTHADYVNAVSRSANELRQARLLLDADAQAYIDAANASTIGN